MLSEMRMCYCNGYVNLIKLALIALLQDSSDHWQGLWAQAFGDVTAVTVDAAELAGGWKPHYAERYKLRLGTAPWEKASEFEVQAAGTSRHVSPPSLQSAPTDQP